MTIDYYQEARTISSSLRKIGLEEEGKRLEDALRFGSTNTEILMSLRYHLRKIVDNAGLPEELRGKCVVLIEAMDFALS